MAKPKLEELEAAYHSGEVIPEIGKVAKMIVAYPGKHEFDRAEKVIYHREKDGAVYVFEVVEELPEE